MRHRGGLCTVRNIFRYMQVTMSLPLYILIYDIQYSKEGCLLPRTWGWKVYTRHLQGSHLLKARTCPSSIKRSLYKCSWIFIAIGYIRVCRVYTFITLPVSSVSNKQDTDWTAEDISHDRISDFSITCYTFRLYSVNNTNCFSFLLSLNIFYIRLFCSVPCTFILK
jgi:hypothetical protein